MAEIRIEVESTLQWMATQCPDSGYWVAECPPLGLCMEGETLDDLHSLIAESCHALFIDLLEDGELDRYLHERGWTTPDMPSEFTKDDVAFSIPWRLVAEGKGIGPERSAH